MSTESKRRRLRNLLKSDPHCFWCGCLVVLGNRKSKDIPNMATLDHFISKNSKYYKKGKRNRLVLSCNDCNHERQRKELLALPKEELWRKSGRYPLEFNAIEIRNINT